MRKPSKTTTRNLHQFRRQRMEAKKRPAHRSTSLRRLKSSYWKPTCFDFSAKKDSGDSRPPVLCPKIEIWRTAKINLPIILRVRAVSEVIRMPERAAMILPSSGITAQEVVIDKAISPHQYRVQDGENV